MPTPFTPVVAECPQCKRRYVEWYQASDLAGKLWKRVKFAPCDICCCPRALPQERSNIVALCLRRRQRMHELYWDECDKNHLDTYYQELLKRGPEAYYAHTPYDNSTLPYQAADRTQSHIRG